LAVTWAAGLALPPRGAQAAPPGNKLVRATLLTDVDSVRPGQPFTAAVLLTIEPGWHVYWKNPGDSGMPTKVDWTVPDGWKVAELRFPIPTRFEPPGNETIIGYEKEVLLTATVTPPDNFPTGGQAKLTADVSWLVCQQVCLPGRTTLNLELPVASNAAGARPANAEVFARWKPRFPRASRQAAEVSLAAGGRYTVQARLPQAGAQDVRWLPVPPESAIVQDPQTKAGAATSTYSFALAPAPRQAQPMQFLVTYKDPEGKQQGVEFTVTLPAPS
jgi:thiol:disulfide interchange protein DsbD